MHTIFLIRLAASALFLMLGFDCKALNNQQKDLEAILKKSFEQIYVAKFGLDYPYTVDMLNNCIKYNDKQCLKSYNSVLAGKKMILSISSVKALQATLDIIERACLLKDDDVANFACYGGIMSFYFYTSPEQDAKILNRIKMYPKNIRNIIFGDEFFWFYNRPNKDIWITAISTMDIDWKSDIRKKTALSLFGKNIEEVKDETWVLK